MPHNIPIAKTILQATTEVASLLGVTKLHNDGDTCYCTTMINGSVAPTEADAVWQVAKTDGEGNITFPENAKNCPDNGPNFSITDVNLLTFYTP